MNKRKLNESIIAESDLLRKLAPLSEVDIFEFMKNLRGGTFFNMGMYTYIPVSRAYKKTWRIYKVLNQTSIVSGVSYENIGTTKDFRDQTGKAPGHAWYNHMPGYENKVGVRKSDPNCKYVLWNIKAGSDCWVRYYLVDIATGDVTPVSKQDIVNSGYLTATEKKSLEATPSTGFNLSTGAVVENETMWRVAAFEHIFWLSQAGQNTKEYGTKFVENIGATRDMNLEESAGGELFRDAHEYVDTDLDGILSGRVAESARLARCAKRTNVTRPMSESARMNRRIPVNRTRRPTHKIVREPVLKESYRRIVSRGKELTENTLFVDFD